MAGAATEKDGCINSKGCVVTLSVSITDDESSCISELSATMSYAG